MAIFKKSAPPKAMHTEEEKELSSTLEAMNLKMINAVCEKYADPSQLNRPLSLYRPLLRMEEGSLFYGSDLEPIDEGVGSSGGEGSETISDFVELFEVGKREGASALFKPRTYSMGQIVYGEGEEGSEFFFLTRGKVASFMLDQSSGEEIELETVKPGEFFGEEAVLAEATRPATVRVIENALLMVANAAELAKLTGENPRFKAKLEEVRQLRVSEAIKKVIRRSI
ncbi:MAG: hypothetical protein C0608_04220 [Deltaproteobacteria bacterium]|nr:MAG: hypothetical protein C0608_04220 [Deltaproteobacteria bacterium]